MKGRHKKQHRPIRNFLDKLIAKQPKNDESEDYDYPTEDPNEVWTLNFNGRTKTTVAIGLNWNSQNKIALSTKIVPATTKKVILTSAKPTVAAKPPSTMKITTVKVTAPPPTTKKLISTSKSYFTKSTTQNIKAQMEHDFKTKINETKGYLQEKFDNSKFENSTGVLVGQSTYFSEELTQPPRLRLTTKVRPTPPDVLPTEKLMTPKDQILFQESSDMVSPKSMEGLTTASAATDEYGKMYTMQLYEDKTLILGKTSENFLGEDEFSTNNKFANRLDADGLSAGPNGAPQEISENNNYNVSSKFNYNLSSNNLYLLSGNENAQQQEQDVATSYVPGSLDHKENTEHYKSHFVWKFGMKGKMDKGGPNEGGGFNGEIENFPKSNEGSTANVESEFFMGGTTSHEGMTTWLDDKEDENLITDVDGSIASPLEGLEHEISSMALIPTTNNLQQVVNEFTDSNAMTSIKSAETTKVHPETIVTVPFDVATILDPDATEAEATEADETLPTAFTFAIFSDSNEETSTTAAVEVTARSQVVTESITYSNTNLGVSVPAAPESSGVTPSLPPGYDLSELSVTNGGNFSWEQRYQIGFPIATGQNYLLGSSEGSSSLSPEVESTPEVVATEAVSKIVESSALTSKLEEPSILTNKLEEPVTKPVEPTTKPEEPTTIPEEPTTKPVETSAATSKPEETTEAPSEEPSAEISKPQESEAETSKPEETPAVTVKPEEETIASASEEISPPGVVTSVETLSSEVAAITELQTPAMSLTSPVETEVPIATAEAATEGATTGIASTTLPITSVVTEKTEGTTTAVWIGDTGSTTTERVTSATTILATTKPIEVTTMAEATTIAETTTMAQAATIAEEIPMTEAQATTMAEANTMTEAIMKTHMTTAVTEVAITGTETTGITSIREEGITTEVDRLSSTQNIPNWSKKLGDTVESKEGAGSSSFVTSGLHQKGNLIESMNIVTTPTSTLSQHLVESVMTTISYITESVTTLIETMSSSTPTTKVPHQPYALTLETTIPAPIVEMKEEENGELQNISVLSETNTENKFGLEITTEELVISDITTKRLSTTTILSTASVPREPSQLVVSDTTIPVSVHEVLEHEGTTKSITKGSTKEDSITAKLTELTQEQHSVTEAQPSDNDKYTDNEEVFSGITEASTASNQFNTENDKFTYTDEVEDSQKVENTTTATTSSTSTEELNEQFGSKHMGTENSGQMGQVSSTFKVAEEYELKHGKIKTMKPETNPPDAEIPFTLATTTEEYDENLDISTLSQHDQRIQAFMSSWSTHKSINPDLQTTSGIVIDPRKSTKIHIGLHISKLDPTPPMLINGETQTSSDEDEDFSVTVLKKHKTHSELASEETETQQTASLKQETELEAHTETTETEIVTTGTTIQVVTTTMTESNTLTSVPTSQELSETTVVDVVNLTCINCDVNTTVAENQKTVLTTTLPLTLPSLVVDTTSSSLQQVTTTEPVYTTEVTSTTTTTTTTTTTPTTTTTTTTIKVQTSSPVTSSKLPLTTTSSPVLTTRKPIDHTTKAQTLHGSEKGEPNDNLTCIACDTKTGNHSGMSTTVKVQPNSNQLQLSEKGQPSDNLTCIACDNKTSTIAGTPSGMSTTEIVQPHPTQSTSRKDQDLTTLSTTTVKVEPTILKEQETKTTTQLTTTEKEPETETIKHTEGTTSVVQPTTMESEKEHITEAKDHEKETTESSVSHSETHTTEAVTSSQHESTIHTTEVSIIHSEASTHASSENVISESYTTLEVTHEPGHGTKFPEGPSSTATTPSKSVSAVSEGFLTVMHEDKESTEGSNHTTQGSVSIAPETHITEHTTHSQEKVPSGPHVTASTLSHSVPIVSEGFLTVMHEDKVSTESLNHTTHGVPTISPEMHITAHSTHSQEKASSEHHTTLGPIQNITETWPVNFPEAPADKTSLKSEEVTENDLEQLASIVSAVSDAIPKLQNVPTNGTHAAMPDDLITTTISLDVLAEVISSLGEIIHDMTEHPANTTKSEGHEEHASEKIETTTSSESHGSHQEHTTENIESTTSSESHISHEEHTTEKMESTTSSETRATHEEHTSENIESTISLESHITHEEHTTELTEPTTSSESHVSLEEHTTEKMESTTSSESHTTHEEHTSEKTESTTSSESFVSHDENTTETTESTTLLESHVSHDEHTESTISPSSHATTGEGHQTDTTKLLGSAFNGTVVASDIHATFPGADLYTSVNINDLVDEFISASSTEKSPDIASTTLVSTSTTHPSTDILTTHETSTITEVSTVHSTETQTTLISETESETTINSSEVDHSSAVTEGSSHASEESVKESNASSTTLTEPVSVVNMKNEESTHQTQISSGTTHVSNEKITIIGLPPTEHLSIVESLTIVPTISTASFFIDLDKLNMSFSNEPATSLIPAIVLNVETSSSTEHITTGSAGTTGQENKSTESLHTGSNIETSSSEHQLSSTTLHNEKESEETTVPEHTPVASENTSESTTHSEVTSVGSTTEGQTEEKSSTSAAEEIKTSTTTHALEHSTLESSSSAAQSSSTIEHSSETTLATTIETTSATSESSTMHTSEIPSSTKQETNLPSEVHSPESSSEASTGQASSTNGTHGAPEGPSISSTTFAAPASLVNMKNEESMVSHTEPKSGTSETITTIGQHTTEHLTNIESFTNIPTISTASFFIELDKLSKTHEKTTPKLGVMGSEHLQPGVGGQTEHIVAADSSTIATTTGEESKTTSLHTTTHVETSTEHTTHTESPSSMSTFSEVGIKVTVVQLTTSAETSEQIFSTTVFTHGKNTEESGFLKEGVGGSAASEGPIPTYGAISNVETTLMQHIPVGESSTGSTEEISTTHEISSASISELSSLEVSSVSTGATHESLFDIETTLMHHIPAGESSATSNEEISSMPEISSASVGEEISSTQEISSASISELPVTQETSTAMSSELSSTHEISSASSAIEEISSVPSENTTPIQSSSSESLTEQSQLQEVTTIPSEIKSETSGELQHSEATTQSQGLQETTTTGELTSLSETQETPTTLQESSATTKYEEAVATSILTVSETSATEVHSVSETEGSTSMESTQAHDISESSTAEPVPTETKAASHEEKVTEMSSSSEGEITSSNILSTSQLSSHIGMVTSSFYLFINKTSSGMELFKTEGLANIPTRSTASFFLYLNKTEALSITPPIAVLTGHGPVSEPPETKGSNIPIPSPEPEPTKPGETTSGSEAEAIASTEPGAESGQESTTEHTAGSEGVTNTPIESTFEIFLEPSKIGMPQTEGAKPMATKAHKILPGQNTPLVFADEQTTENHYTTVSKITNIPAFHPEEYNNFTIPGLSSVSPTEEAATSETALGQESTAVHPATNVVTEISSVEQPKLNEPEASIESTSSSALEQTNTELSATEESSKTETEPMQTESVSNITTITTESLTTEEQKSTSAKVIETTLDIFIMNEADTTAHDNLLTSPEHPMKGNLDNAEEEEHKPAPVANTPKVFAEESLNGTTSGSTNPNDDFTDVIYSPTTKMKHKGHHTIVSTSTKVPPFHPEEYNQFTIASMTSTSMTEGSSSETPPLIAFTKENKKHSTKHPNEMEHYKLTTMDIGTPNNSFIEYIYGKTSTKKHKQHFGKKHKSTENLKLTTLFTIPTTCKHTALEKSKSGTNMTTTTTTSTPRTTILVYLNLPTRFLNSSEPVPNFEMYFTASEDYDEESVDETLSPYHFKSMKIGDFKNITEYPITTTKSVQPAENIKSSYVSDATMPSPTTEMTTNTATTTTTSEAATTTTTTTTTTEAKISSTIVTTVTTTHVVPTTTCLTSHIPEDSNSIQDHPINEGFESKLCSVDKLIKDLQEKSRDSNFTSAIANHVCEQFIHLNKSGIKVGRKRRRRTIDLLPDFLPFPISPDVTKFRREIILTADIKTALNRDVQLEESDIHKYATPGSKVKIACVEGKNLSTKDFNITWSYGKNQELTGGKVQETGSGLLIIENVDPADGGNYTCTVSNIHLGMRSFRHLLSVITLPTMDINTTILYEMNADCSKQDEEIVSIYFNGVIRQMLCGKEHPICSIEVINATCINRQRRFISVSLVFHMEIMHVIVPTLNTTQCDVLCQMKIYTKLISVVVNNILVFETQPVIYRQTREILLTPSNDTTLATYEITEPPKLIIACPPGYGLLGDKHICVACGKNMYSNGAVAFCMPCPPHYFQPSAGSKSCIKCTSPFQDQICLTIMIPSVKQYKTYAIVALAVLLSIAICIICLRCRRDSPKNTKRKSHRKKSRFSPAETSLSTDIEAQAHQELQHETPHSRKASILSNKRRSALNKPAGSVSLQLRQGDLLPPSVQPLQYQQNDPANSLHPTVGSVLSKPPGSSQLQQIGSGYPAMGSFISKPPGSVSLQHPQSDPANSIYPSVGSPRNPFYSSVIPPTVSSNTYPTNLSNAGANEGKPLVPPEPPPFDF